MTEHALTILLEDAELVAVEKPAWWVVHPTRGAREALIVLHALQDQLGCELFPVHRLDRQTSGVLVFAKSAAVAAIMGPEFAEGRTRKSYLGLCRGVIPDELTIDHPVNEHGVRRPACTDVTPLEVFCDRYTFLRLRPRTGRRHQLRAHLKHIAHPLVGDTGYGRTEINHFFRERFGLARLFLHAESLRVLHPRELRYVELSSPLPTELEVVLEQLRVHQGPVP